MFFDFHTHFFPDKVAPKALGHLLKRGMPPASFDGTRAGLLESMRGAGIDLSLNLPVATAPDQVPGINDMMIRENAAPIYCFGAMHPLFPRQQEELCRLADAGIKGIKMHPEFQSFDPVDKCMEIVYRTCTDRGLVVLFHAGEDMAFTAPFKSTPAKFAELNDMYPELKLVLGHFGSLLMWDEVEEHLTGRENVYLETSFGLGILPDDKLLRMIREHGVSKVLFGTDAPWRSQKEDVETFNRLELTDIEKDRISHLNAIELTGYE